MGPRHRVLAAAAIGLPVAIVGAVLAVIAAVLGSPIFPIGVADQAEPDPGFRFDGAAVGLGFAVVVAVVVATVVAAGIRTARATSPVREVATPALTARTTEQIGTSPPVAVGIHFVLDRGRQRHALPVRSSLFGAAFGALVVTAVLVFSAGLDHLVTTPAEFGWTWDLAA